MESSLCEFCEVVVCLVLKSWQKCGNSGVEDEPNDEGNSDEVALLSSYSQ